MTKLKKDVAVGIVLVSSPRTYLGSSLAISSAERDAALQQVLSASTSCRTTNRKPTSPST